MSAEQYLYQLELIVKDQFLRMQEMIELLKEENNAIVRFNLEEIQGCLDRKEALQSKLASLETYRTKVIKQLADLAEIAPEEISISSIEQHFPEQNTTGLSSLFRENEKSFNAYRRAIKQNQMLLRSSLVSVRRSVEEIAKASETNASYSQNGMINKQGNQDSLMRVKA